MIVSGIDHISLHVADVELSVAFYKDIVGLAVVPRPAFNFRGAWFALGDGQTLHLIEGRSTQPHWGSRGTHIAFAVPDILSTALHFEQNGIAHTQVKARPDGVRQFFVTDPDGYSLEFCEANPS